MKRNLLSRKIRQLKHLRKQMDAHKNGTSVLSNSSLKKVLSKAQILFSKVRSLLMLRDTKRLVGTFGVACLLSGSSVNAQTFAPPVTNPFGLAETVELEAIFIDLGDFDGDGDLDILCTGYDNNGDQDLIFTENIGSVSSPDFASPVSSPFRFGDDFDSGFVPVDIDNDGDLDISFISAEYDSNSEYGLFFSENTGTAQSPMYPEVVLNDFGIEVLDQEEGVLFQTFGDLDADGDLDLIGGSFYEMPAFFENTGSAEAPHFAPFSRDIYNISPRANTSLGIPDLVDIDNDGDLDLMISGYFYDETNEEYFQKVYFSENTGTPQSPSFAEVVEDPFGLYIPSDVISVPMFHDIDNDGDADLFVLSIGYETEMFYFENTSPASVESISEWDFDVFPNPTNDILNIDLDEIIPQIRIMDLQGRVVQVVTNAYRSVSLNDLSKGMYNLHFVFKDGTQSTAKISRL